MLKAAKIDTVISLVMTPCSLVGKYNFGGTYCFHFLCIKNIGALLPVVQGSKPHGGEILCTHPRVTNLFPQCKVAEAWH